MAQLFAPTSARLLWAMINARAALTFGSRGGEARAGPGCRAPPRWQLGKGPEVLTGVLGGPGSSSPPCLHPSSPAGAGLGPTRPHVHSSGARTEVVLGKAEESSLGHTAGGHRTAQETSWDTTRGAQHIPGASQHVLGCITHPSALSKDLGHTAGSRSTSWGTEHIPGGTLRASWGAQRAAGHILGHGVHAELHTVGVQVGSQGCVQGAHVLWVGTGHVPGTLLGL